MGIRRTRATDVEVDTTTGPGSTRTWNPESGIRNPESGIRKRKGNYGIMETKTETETETEYGIRERRFQAIDLKKYIYIYISNDNKINKQIYKKKT